ncbi:TetR family transcriptional regulator [Streptomyces tagetis]|uniref:TetR family transcriptional regulator n=1 Tax=Streptomyces tagetis TaxID=2820809 RepID=A0A940XGM9_9ACTN|nr:TetR family transcriptional regulator [Streptomyces sp. RG38]MBQ0826802.1 TetR family transcriptional regulator [Streptomyces sp. RG38]
MTESGNKSDWRERKKAATRRSIQGHAMRLFLEKGYDATRVEEIAAAAGVSIMTFFRYFPTKEHVAAEDDYDFLIARLVEDSADGEPLVGRIHQALRGGLAQIYATDRQALLDRTRLILTTPALQGRMWQNQAVTQQHIVRALSGETVDKDGELRLKVQVAASFAIATVAMLEWAAAPEEGELPDRIDKAFAAFDEGARKG